MFAVPGWSVSAPLVTEPLRKASNVETNSNKRKRNESASDATTPAQRTSPTDSVKTHRGNGLPSETSKSGKTSQPARQTGQQKQSKPKYEDRGASQETGGRSRDGTGKSLASRKHSKRDHVAASTGVEQDDRQKYDLKTSAATTDANPRSAGPKSSTLPPPTSKLTPLQAKMRDKLTSARFRHLNETLYTTTSAEALDLFTKSPDMFTEYHAGFAQQVKDSWPENPVTGYVKSIKTRGTLTNPVQSFIPLPRRKTGSCTIADLGCGDAPLARGCQSHIKSLTLKFHNYDLHAANTLVTKADISNLPLRDGEADVVVFCLSLMGTNWISFVEEAWRVLRGDGKGEVWVAEVKSRFGRVIKGRVVDNSVGKRRKVSKASNREQDGGPEQFVEDERMADQPDDETDLSTFIKVFTRRGFQLRDGSVNKTNKMFATMIFTKSGIPTAGKHKGLRWTGKQYVKQDGMGTARFGKPGVKIDGEEITIEEEAKALKPCVYKTR